MSASSVSELALAHSGAALKLATTIIWVLAELCL